MDRLDPRRSSALAFARRDKDKVGRQVAQEKVRAAGNYWCANSFLNHARTAAVRHAYTVVRYASSVRCAFTVRYAPTVVYNM